LELRLRFSARFAKGVQSGLWTRMATGKRFIVRADEKLTAFLKLETAI
jgi:hypothetical protein